MRNVRAYADRNKGWGVFFDTVLSMDWVTKILHCKQLFGVCSWTRIWCQHSRFPFRAKLINCLNCTKWRSPYKRDISI